MTKCHCSAQWAEQMDVECVQRLQFLVLSTPFQGETGPRDKVKGHHFVINITPRNSRLTAAFSVSVLSQSAWNGERYEQGPLELRYLDPFTTRRSCGPIVATVMAFLVYSCDLDRKHSLFPPFWSMCIWGSTCHTLFDVRRRSPFVVCPPRYSWTSRHPRQQPQHHAAGHEDSWLLIDNVFRGGRVCLYISTLRCDVPSRREYVYVETFSYLYNALSQLG